MVAELPERLLVTSIRVKLSRMFGPARVEPHSLKQQLPHGSVTGNERQILVHNAGAGRSQADVPEGHFPGFVPVPIEDAMHAVTQARDSGSLETVAVWGGDGTMRSVAELLTGTDVALLAGPGGTHNHFARDLGLVDLDAVDAALRAERRVRIDVGMAANHVFLNNANAGWYVELVARRERLERLMPRPLAKALSLIWQLGRTRRLQVALDGEPAKVWMIWIGNGRFSTEPGRLATRDDQADGVLDVRLLRAEGRMPKLRVFLSLLGLTMRGRDPVDSPLLERHLVGSSTFTFRRESVRFALDGELLRLPSPVHFSCRARALSVLVPPSAPPFDESDVGVRKRT